MNTLPIVVQKYGGSSVADPARLSQVAARVAATREAGKRVVVVVSAMGDTTDGLLALAAKVSKAPPRRELDMLLTAGERISMALLSMALQARGVDAISFTGSQSGIITNDAHAGARILEVRPYRIQDELERGRVVIVAGYQGVSYKKEVTTLGRGGSDTTAVALAAALSAEVCEICTDVDGVYTADPRSVPEATRIETLSLDEMLVLSDGGGRVLHRAALDFARAAGIALWVRATASDPLEASGGTLVRVGAPSSKPRVLAVASRPVSRVELKAEADLSGVLEALAAMGVMLPDLIARADGSATFVVGTEDLHGGLPQPLLEAKSRGRACVYRDRRALSLVGSAFDRLPGVMLQARAVLESAGAVIEVTIASPQRITFVLEASAAQMPALERALHASLVLSKAQA